MPTPDRVPAYVYWFPHPIAKDLVKVMGPNVLIQGNYDSHDLPNYKAAWTYVCNERLISRPWAEVSVNHLKRLQGILTHNATRDMKVQISTTNPTGSYREPSKYQHCVFREDTSTLFPDGVRKYWNNDDFKMFPFMQYLIQTGVPYHQWPAIFRESLEKIAYLPPSADEVPKMMETFWKTLDTKIQSKHDPSEIAAWVQIN